MSNIVLSTNRNNCRIIAGQCQRWDQNDYCSTCGSLILLFSAASELSRSHDNDQTMIKDRMIKPRSSKDHHDLLLKDQITGSKPSPGQLCPHCHHNAMVILTGLRSTWSHFSSSCSGRTHDGTSSARRAQRATAWFGSNKRPPAPTLCIYIQLHIHVYT